MLKRLFGRNQKEKPYVDKDGIYFYAQCGRCETKVKSRADRRYDLGREDGGLSWHKTLVCTKCFQRMPVVVMFDSNYNVKTQDIEGGLFISAEKFAEPPPSDDDEAPAE